jgi:hypothetical protein
VRTGTGKGAGPRTDVLVEGDQIEAAEERGQGTSVGNSAFVYMKAHLLLPESWARTGVVNGSHRAMRVLAETRSPSLTCRSAP